MKTVNSTHAHAQKHTHIFITHPLCLFNIKVNQVKYEVVWKEACRQWILLRMFSVLFVCLFICQCLWAVQRLSLMSRCWFHLVPHVHTLLTIKLDKTNWIIYWRMFSYVVGSIAVASQPASQPCDDIYFFENNLIFGTQNTLNLERMRTDTHTRTRTHKTKGEIFGYACGCEWNEREHKIN